MTTEMGESLMQSYFKHVKGCLISQTNWKLSGNWHASEDGKCACKSLFRTIEADTVFSGIFNIKLEQILKQTEIDVVGIDANNTIYMAEVAFHERGLQFGNKRETQDIFAKKMLRAYLAALYLFPHCTYEIFFASPKIVPNADVSIREIFPELQNHFESDKVHFHYIVDEDFRDTILLPAYEITQSETDTSELFLRSIKLLELFNFVQPSTLKRKTKRTLHSEKSSIKNAQKMQ